MGNYWANRWRSFKDNCDKAEDEALEREAQEAEQMPTYPCDDDDCDGIAHYRPGVGGWWCIKCRRLIVK